jgi:DNA-binding transcriptional MerR regulator/effector-binding domain-containing protein
MITNTHKTFTTGEFAKICGVNKRTLFHYHDIGLLVPSIVDDKGYRYYSFHQLETFYLIKILKELNMPLSEIESYLNQRNPKKLIALSLQKIADVDLEIEKLKQIRHSLETTINYVEKGLTADCSQITVEMQETEYLILSSLMTSKDNSDFTNWMLAFMNFENAAHTSDTSFAGMMVSRENILAQNFKSIATKPQGLYAIAYHRGDYESKGSTYQKLIEFARENHLTLGNYAYEEYLLDDLSVLDPADSVTQITLALEEG